MSVIAGMREPAWRRMIKWRSMRSVPALLVLTALLALLPARQASGQT